MEAGAGVASVVSEDEAHPEVEATVVAVDSEAVDGVSPLTRRKEVKILARDRSRQRRQRRQRCQRCQRRLLASFISATGVNLSSIAKP